MFFSSFHALLRSENDPKQLLQMIDRRTNDFDKTQLKQVVDELVNSINTRIPAGNMNSKVLTMLASSLVDKMN